VIEMPSQQCLLAWEVPTLCVLSAGACKAGFASVRELHSGEPVHRSQITFQTWVGQSCFCSGLESNSTGFLFPSYLCHLSLKMRSVTMLKSLTSCAGCVIL